MTKRNQPIKPNESVVIRGMKTLDKVKLLEEFNNLAESNELPENVSLKCCKVEQRYRPFSNLFPGYMNTQELITYLKEEVGSMASRFKNI